MGGGGGGGSRSLGDTSALEQRAKEILERGGAQRKNVFISFAYEDVNEVNLLRGHSKSETSDIEFNDRSVKEPYDSVRAEYIRMKLRERISQCSTTLVYLSSSTEGSDWVKWEVEKSRELGKRIIVVHSGPRPTCAVPSFLKSSDIDVIPWSKLARELKKP